MGLDTSHDCWHGPYSAFSRWRQKVAEAAGYAVWNVKYDDGTTMPTVMIDWGHIPDETREGEWKEMPADALLVLIAHSDCDGVIHPAQAEALAKRLEELAPLVSSEGDHFDFQARTEAFAKGLREAAAAGEDVDFH